MRKLIDKLFKTQKKTNPELTVEDLMPRFEKIILKWLDFRDSEKGDFFWYEPSDEDSKFPRYVMKMIREINDQMPHPMMDKVKSKEKFACGHVDYVHKFSLYCSELYIFAKTQN